MPTIPNTIYQIRGDLKWNVASTQPATWKGAPVTRVNFKNKECSEQWERDRKKDSILEKSGVPLLRLLTTMSREEERIKQALDSLET